MRPAPTAKTAPPATDPLMFDGELHAAHDMSEVLYDLWEDYSKARGPSKSNVVLTERQVANISFAAADLAARLGRLVDQFESLRTVDAGGAA